jgi:hypothetical protein
MGEYLQNDMGALQCGCGGLIFPSMPFDEPGPLVAAQCDRCGQEFLLPGKDPAMEREHHAGTGGKKEG